jgi:hypothetical protein
LRVGILTVSRQWAGLLLGLFTGGIFPRAVVLALRFAITVASIAGLCWAVYVVITRLKI